MSNDAISDVAPPSLPKGLAGFRRLLAHIGRVEVTLAIIALTIVVALSTSQALLRYFLGTSLWWAQEVAEVTVLVTYFLGISYVFKTRQEIFIEFLSAMLPIRMQILLYMLEQLFAFAFAVALLWLMVLFVPTMFNLQSPVLKISGFWTYVPLALSTVSIAVTSVYYCLFGLWAYRNRLEGKLITDVEAHGLVLRPWVEPT